VTQHVTGGGHQAPGKQLADLQHSSQGMRGNPDVKQRHSQHPLGQGQSRALQQGPCHNGEMIPTGLVSRIATTPLLHPPDLGALVAELVNPGRPSQAVEEPVGKAFAGYHVDDTHREPWNCLLALYGKKRASTL